MNARLGQRCPGFFQCAEDYRRAHLKEREFLWLRLISWIDDKIFSLAKAEGWPHELGYFAARDPRLDRVRAYCQVRTAGLTTLIGLPAQNAVIWSKISEN